METRTTFRVTFLRLSTPSQAATPNCITSETNKGGSLHSLSRSARQRPQLACQFAWIQHHKKVSRRWGFRRLGRGSGGKYGRSISVGLASRCGPRAYQRSTGFRTGYAEQQRNDHAEEEASYQHGFVSDWEASCCLPLTQASLPGDPATVISPDGSIWGVPANVPFGYRSTGPFRGQKQARLRRLTGAAKIANLPGSSGPR
jgi:hypothetical protein